MGLEKFEIIEERIGKLIDKCRQLKADRDHIAAQIKGKDQEVQKLQEEVKRLQEEKSGAYQKLDDILKRLEALPLDEVFDG